MPNDNKPKLETLEDFEEFAKNPWKMKKSLREPCLNKFKNLAEEQQQQIIINVCQYFFSRGNFLRDDYPIKVFFRVFLLKSQDKNQTLLTILKAVSEGANVTEGVKKSLSPLTLLANLQDSILFDADNYKDELLLVVASKNKINKYIRLLLQYYKLDNNTIKECLEYFFGPCEQWSIQFSPNGMAKCDKDTIDLLRMVTGREINQSNINDIILLQTNGAMIDDKNRFDTQAPAGSSMSSNDSIKLIETALLQSKNFFNYYEALHEIENQAVYQPTSYILKNAWQGMQCDKKARFIADALIFDTVYPRDLGKWLEFRTSVARFLLVGILIDLSRSDIKREESSKILKKIVDDFLEDIPIQKKFIQYMVHTDKELSQLTLNGFSMMIKVAIDDIFKQKNDYILISDLMNNTRNQLIQVVVEAMATKVETTLEGMKNDAKERLRDVRNRTPHKQQISKPTRSPLGIFYPPSIKKEKEKRPRSASERTVRMLTPNKFSLPSELEQQDPVRVVAMAYDEIFKLVCSKAMVLLEGESACCDITIEDKLTGKKEKIHVKQNIKDVLSCLRDAYRKNNCEGVEYLEQQTDYALRVIKGDASKDIFNRNLELYTEIKNILEKLKDSLRVISLRENEVSGLLSRRRLFCQ
jgi:DNA-binding protein YbaB